MKLRRLQMDSFAGFRNRQIVFGPGLNVLLGPNDIGKSSVFRAIDCALFLPAKLSKTTKEGKELLPRLIPIGSDHAKLQLEFDAEGGVQRIEKIWGQGQSVALECSDGSKLSQEEKIEARLRMFLPVPPVTFQSVLFVQQSSLDGTVKALQEKREALHSLGDLLRLAVDQTAGVSVERLKALLQEKIDAVFSHWDLLTNLPEKGKGLENRWVKGVGLVLAAYYTSEELKRDALLARELENEQGRKLSQLNEKQACRHRAREFVKVNEKFVDSVSERQALEAKIAKARADSESIVKDLSSWMQAESDRRTHKPEVERLEAQKLKLDEELKYTLEQVKKREAVSRFEKARAARAALDEERKRLAVIPPLKPEDLRRLRASIQQVDQLKSSMKASRLQLRFEVKKDLELLVRKDFEPERKGRMVPGKGMTISAGGRIQIESDLFELQVTSGEVSAAEIEDQLRQANDALAKLQAEFKVQTFDEAQERNELYLEAVAAVRSAEFFAKGFLVNGEKYEDLEALASAAASVASVREPEVVQAEVQLVSKDLSAKRDGLIRAESLLKDLERRHEVADSALLTQKMVDAKSELSVLEKKIATLPPLPESLGNLEDFLQRFRQSNLEVSSLGEEIQSLSVAIAELKAKLPDQSAQDLERAAIEAETLFRRELARGRALLRVRDAISMVEGRSEDLYQGFRIEFEREVGRLSAGKYAQAGMSQALPTEFKRIDGAKVPYEWLSAGTKDAFALALRLSMAVYFLGSADGFLLIDDPLVNMDPERQKIAASLIREFSEKRQVVVFTCHPTHADLLGGTRIEL